MIALVVLAAVAVALTNGANDNFKGVATLFGSKAASYRTALTWATCTTFAGSIVAAIFAASLAKAFSGSGIVSASISASPAFLSGVALAAAATVLLATRLGMPVSTTHALLGALVGAGLVAAGTQIHLAVLGTKLVLPLLLSPVLSLVLTRVLYPLAHAARTSMGIERTSCVCVGETFVPVAALMDGSAAAATGTAANVWAGKAPECIDRYDGTVIGITAQRVLDALHFLSAGAMSFARGLNDTPKIVGVLVATGALSHRTGTLAIGCAIAVGGVLGARRVAETVSHGITRVPAGQGLVANLVTAALVTLATPLGLPVSTTHVATGSLVGIGVTNGTAQWRTIGKIAIAWVTTLPFAAVLGALAYAVLARF